VERVVQEPVPLLNSNTALLAVAPSVNIVCENTMLLLTFVIPKGKGTVVVVESETIGAILSLKARTITSAGVLP
jgi:hypothetical protein